MIINIVADRVVYISDNSLQTGSEYIPVQIKEPLPHHVYKISINGNNFQEIKRGKIKLPEFTIHDKHVIIKVEISQMGKVVKTLDSDEYPIKLIPVIGNTLTEAFPVGLSQIVNSNEDFRKILKEDIDKFKNEVNASLKDFEERVLHKENEGEIV